jgi:Zn-dependent M16 (insulinase) family peptidase
MNFNAGIGPGYWVLFRKWLNSITSESNGSFENEVADKLSGLHMRLMSNKNDQLDFDQIF